MDGWKACLSLAKGLFSVAMPVSCQGGYAPKFNIDTQKRWFGKCLSFQIWGDDYHNSI